MPDAIQDFEAISENREKAAGFLAAQFAKLNGGDSDLWLERMAHWWDRNPAADDHPARAWCMDGAGGMRAFVGVIPFRYRFNGRRITALAGTSWAMAPEVRSSVIAMALCLQRLGEKVVLLTTTPSPEVRLMLEKGGWSVAEDHQRIVVPALRHLRTFFLRGQDDPPEGCRFVTHLDDVHSLKAPELPPDTLSREVSLEHLRWYLGSPAREHHLGAWVDREGVLQAWVVVASSQVRGQPAWEVVESVGNGVEALTNACLDQLPSRHWLVLNRLSQGRAAEWKRVLPLKVGHPALSLFHRAPSTLGAHAKHWQMAEGDLGL